MEIVLTGMAPGANMDTVCSDTRGNDPYVKAL
jgi:hypothetical protein